MDLTFLSQADNITLKLELAKRALDTAKAELEQSKQAYDEMLTQADAHGIPKAKLKKLTEDRVQAILESGILGAKGVRNESFAAVGTDQPKRERRKSVKRNDFEPRSIGEDVSADGVSAMASADFDALAEVEG